MQDSNGALFKDGELVGGVRKISFLHDKSGDFNSTLKLSKIGKAMVESIVLLLKDVKKTWNGTYIDPIDGLIYDMVLKGEPMDALNECIRGMTIAYMALPELIDPNEIEKYRYEVNEYLIKAEKDLYSKSSIIICDKSNMVGKVRSSRMTREDKDFMIKWEWNINTINHESIMSASKILKAFQLLLHDTESDYFHDTFNMVVLALDIYLKYIDYQILDMNRYNFIMYGKPYSKSEDEINREIESSYIVNS